VLGSSLRRLGYPLAATGHRSSQHLENDGGRPAEHEQSMPFIAVIGPISRQRSPYPSVVWFTKRRRMLSGDSGR
jgi:hypothetical protein